MRARSRHPKLGCATPHLLATAPAVGDDDPGKVDTGDHRQRRAQQARDVGDVQRVDRGCVYLYECLVRVGLRHCFGTNCQRLRRRTALLDYDRVHLRDACGGHSGLLSSRWLAYGVAPSDVSAPRMLDAVWAPSSLRRRTKAGPTSCSGGVGWSRGSLGERLLAPRGPGSDRRGGDDGEEHESACGEECGVEAERQRLVDWVMGGDEVVGPAGCDRRQYGESERSADLLGCVDEA